MKYYVIRNPEDFTIPPGCPRRAPQLLPGAGAEGMAPTPRGPLDVSGRDAVVAARLDTAVEGEEQAVLAAKVVQLEAAEVSAQSYKGSGT